MNKEFEVDENTIKFAAEKLKLQNSDDAIFLGNKYRDLIKSIPYQYMAHTIRTVENYVRRETKSPCFCIICEPMCSPTDVASKLATARYKKGSFLIIVYDDRVEDDQKRTLIAHELGHLFIAVAGNRESGEYELLSTMFGILVMLHKKMPFQNHANELALVDECINIMEKLRN